MQPFLHHSYHSSFVATTQPRYRHHPGGCPARVRAQAASIYAKSRTDGRPQFISLFIEELLADDVQLATGSEKGPARAATQR